MFLIEPSPTKKCSGLVEKEWNRTTKIFLEKASILTSKVQQVQLAYGCRYVSYNNDI